MISTGQRVPFAFGSPARRDSWSACFRLESEQRTCGFDPSDEHLEYSAIATNKTLNGRNLWAFLNGRGCQEKAYAELKNGFAFDAVPTAHYGANSAYQALSIMAFYLVRSFQVATGARQRGRTRTGRTIFDLQTIQTLCYKRLNRAGTIIHPQSKPTLDVGMTGDIKRRLQLMTQQLRPGSLINVRLGPVHPHANSLSSNSTISAFKTFSSTLSNT